MKNLAAPTPSAQPTPPQSPETVTRLRVRSGVRAGFMVEISGVNALLGAPRPR